MASKEPKKMDLKSMDVIEDQKRKLKEVFPNVFNESKVDFERLRLSLGDEVDVSPERERYGINWPGKAECMKVIQQPSIGTLKPSKKESIDFEETENLFIEGDNLEILKLLQNSYYGKIKMIYIDPPYNTGKEFIYPDKYSESLETYLAYTGQIDDEGKKFSTNTEADGRFHTKWLNMMYPRLYLARNLLQRDGMIFISIDDNEASNLRKICDEIFGEENFVDCIIWKKRYGGGAKEKHLVTVHEYILFYAKDKESLGELFIPLDPASIERYYKFKDHNFQKRGPYRTHPLEAGKAVDERPNLIFPIIAPDGTKITPERQWYWNEERVKEAIQKGEIEFVKGKNGWTVHSKQYLKEENGEIRQAKAFSLIDDVYSQHGTNEMIEIFGNAKVFSYPKPSNLIEQLINIATNSKEQHCILDFFAGSASTAHAALNLNMQDGGGRKFIAIQLPEPCSGESDAFKAGYKNIAEIGKERLRRVIKKCRKEQKEIKQEGTLFDDGKGQKNMSDIGFKVFKLDKSNFNIWESKSEEKKGATNIEKQLELHINHIDSKATADDILYELLLKSGFPLTTKVEEKAVAGKKVYSIESGALLICLEKELTKEVITEMARLEPARVVCLDQGFSGNDQLKTNAVQIMKSHRVNDFRTV